MHCFEGPEWQHLKRGRESFAWGPDIKADPLGRCGAALVYGQQMTILKAAQVIFHRLISFHQVHSFWYFFLSLVPFYHFSLVAGGSYHLVNLFLDFRFII
jgi:hypothetical protein